MFVECTTGPVAGVVGFMETTLGLPIPDRTNAADWVLDLLDEHNPRASEVATSWAAQMQERPTTAIVAGTKIEAKRRPDGLHQFRVLVHRAHLQVSWKVECGLTWFRKWKFSLVATSRGD